MSKQATHTTFYKFEEGISFAEHWKLVAESSEFHLALKRPHRVHFFQLEIRQKKRDILSEKRESGMALKSASLRPKAVLLTPMNQVHSIMQVALKLTFRKYPSIHTNYIISHSTILQYNHNI